MSNFLLQNAGISAFFEEDDLLFGGDAMNSSEMDEDDLPLTNYLLKFDVDEDEPWESGEDLSVGGEIVDEEGIFELSWPDQLDLETGMSNHVDEEFTLEKEDSARKPELVKNKVVPAKKTESADKKEPVNKSVVVDFGNNKKEKNTSLTKSTVKAACSVQFDLKSTNSSKGSTSSKKEPQKASIKTQAEKAKQQRERKKKHVQELHDTIAELKQDKTNLQHVTTQLNDKIQSLEEEICYLKGVISNQSELATILRSVANTPGISISCSVLQDDKGNNGKNNKRKCDPAGKEGVHLSDDNTKKKKKMDIEVTGEMTNVGVCVHVQSGKVSLEFCPECSKKANSALS